MPQAEGSHRFARTTVAVALALLGVWIAAGFLPALIWAVVIAIAIDPLYLRAERRWPRSKRYSALPALVTAAVALLGLAPVAFGVVRAAQEAHDAALWIAAAQQNGIPVPGWVNELPFGRDVVWQWWQDNLATPEGTAHQIHRFGHDTLLAHSRLVSSAVLRRATVFVFTLITLFFLLRDRDRIVAQLIVAGDRLLGPQGERLGRQIIRSVRGTIDGLVLVGIGEGVAMTLVYVVCGVPHPLLLGALTAVAAMIPFGAAVLFAVAALLLIGQGAVVMAIVVVAIGFVVVGIADHFVRPVLIGGSTRLPFLWVLIGILGGVESFGLLGLFVGPATMAALMMLWREFVGGEGRTAAIR